MDVKKFIFSSSATVYGEPEKIPITEDTQNRRNNKSIWNNKIVYRTNIKRYI